MKIKSIEFHDENNALALRVEGVSYKTFLLVAQDITRFISTLDTPEMKAEEIPAPVAEPVEKTRKPRAAKPAPEPVEAPVAVAEPDPRQVTVEEVIARKTEPAAPVAEAEPLKVIEAIVVPASVVFNEVATTVVPSFPVVAQTVSPEESTLSTFELDARSILSEKDLGKVIPMAVQIWKDHKDAVLEHGKAFTNKCSGVLAGIVGEALKIDEKEAFGHIKDALKASWVQEQAQKVSEETAATMLKAAKEIAAEPAPVAPPAPAESSDRAELFLEKLVKRPTQALKDALIVGCELVVTEEAGKRTVTRSALQRLFSEIKGCHAILADEAAVTRALDSSQMPIFAALPPTRAKWLKDN